MAGQVKVCSKCKIEKPASEFHKNKNTKSGLKSRCIECTREDRGEKPRSKHPVSSSGFKVCARCFSHKLITEFGLNSHAWDGLQSWCLSCTRLYARERAAGVEPLTSQQAMEIKTMYDYGLSSAQVDRLLNLQTFRCAACGDKLKDSHIPNLYRVGAGYWVVCPRCMTVINLVSNNSVVIHSIFLLMTVP